MNVSVFLGTIHAFQFFCRLRVLTTSVKKVEFCFKLIYKLIISLSVKCSQFCIVVDMLLKINVVFTGVITVG